MSLTIFLYGCYLCHIKMPMDIPREFHARGLRLSARCSTTGSASC